MKLTETQARRAIRKWLFEYATDSGVSHRPSTDDNIAGQLGDDREDQPASTIPQETPIIATSQMGTQLTDAMPPIEDPDFIPGTVEELGRSVDLLSRQVPHEEIEWFYEKMQELADEAIEKRAIGDLSAIGDSIDGETDDPIRPSQMSSQEAAAATNESWNRWRKMLHNALSEAKWSNARQRDFGRKWKQGDPLRLHRNDDDPIDQDYDDAVGDGEPLHQSGMSGSEEGGVYRPSQADMEDMAAEMDMDIEDLFGFDPRKHKSKEERQADLASGEFDGDAKLRELVDLGIYPQIRTMSGMRKKIKAEIDPIVQMWATARPAFDWLTGWLEDSYQLSWDGKQIAGPDVYEMAIKAYEKTHKNDPAKLLDLVASIESGEFYKEAMAEIVMAPIIRKWVAEVKSGGLDVSSSKAKNTITMSDWILETVLNSGFGKSRAPRRAAKLVTAMGAMNDFKDAMALAVDNQKTDLSEDED